MGIWSDPNTSFSGDVPSRDSSGSSGGGKAVAAGAGAGGIGCLAIGVIALVAIAGGGGGGGRNNSQTQSNDNSPSSPQYGNRSYDLGTPSYSSPTPYSAPSSNPIYAFPPALSAKDSAVWRRPIKIGECLTEGHKSQYYTYRTSKPYSSIYPQLRTRTGIFDVYSLQQLKHNFVSLNHEQLSKVADHLHNMNAEFNRSGKPDRLITNAEALASKLHDDMFACNGQLVYRVVETPFRTAQISNTR